MPYRPPRRRFLRQSGRAVPRRLAPLPSRRVDTAYGEVHNRLVRRLVAAMVVLALSASVASMTCAGWQATAAERMDCCESAHDGCADQLSADACCARTEQAQQQLVVAVANFPVSLVAVAAAPPSIIQHHHPPAAVAFERALRRYPHSPPFLSAVLLI
jgi:hypothetical protein